MKAYERPQAGHALLTDEPPESAPALTALFGYLRPLHRSRLLAQVADLGIFVTEYQGPPAGIQPGTHDIIILAASGAEGDLELATMLAAESEVLAIVPGEDDGEAYRAAGLESLWEDVLEGSLGPLLMRVARRARDRRRPSPEASEIRVCGEIRLLVQSRELCSGQETLALTRAERDVLLALSTAPGRPVPLSAFRRRGGIAGASARDIQSVVVRIRRKIQQLGGDPLQVGTVLGFGYVLMPWATDAGRRSSAR